MSHRQVTLQIFALAMSWLPIYSPVGAQTLSPAPQRIQLRAGGPAQILKGEIKGRKEVVYVFKAKAGQRFSGRITRQSGDASFSVTDPDGEALPEEEYDVNTKLRGSLTKSGDYRLTVNTVNASDSKYTLSVRVY
jgi:hypothetical protein